MPRTPLEPRFTVEYLSILDSDGNLDTALEPDLGGDELKRMYRAMLLGRRLDERMVRLQRQGRIGTFAPIKGQEAAQIGSVVTLAKTDWMVPSFRETAAMLWRGWPLEKLLLFFAGYLEGGQPGPEQHDLPITIPVATQLPHAVGLAYAAQYRGDEAVVMVYFGDGATSEGDFHEAMNFAGVWHLPIVFVCQNNQWAISVPFKKQTHARTIAQKALAYGLPGLQVDGNDVLAVHAACREAVDRAREGDGPTLIECVTYRLGVHTTADDPTKYRSDEEVKEWERKDPLTRFSAYLDKKNLLEAGLEEQVDAEIAQAVATFEAAGPADPLTIFDHVYADLPEHLRREREELAERLRAELAERLREEPARRPGQAPPDAEEPPATPPPTSPPMRGQRTSSRWQS
jgi:pyruvate dehydrogenase E1 component alpha subunit